MRMTRMQSPGLYKRLQYHFQRRPILFPHFSTMRFSSFVSAASAVAVASLVVADTDAEKVSDVVNVTQDTFESTVNSEPLILVEFYAPWFVRFLVLVVRPFLKINPGVDTANHWLRITKRQPQR